MGLNGWREARVADLVADGSLAINDGYRVRNTELGSVGTPFVRGGDIGDGWILTDVADRIRPEFQSRVVGKLTSEGDIAFITKGTVGRVGYLRAGQPSVVFAPQVCYWRVLDAAVLDQRFLYFLLNGPEFKANLDAVKTHGSMVADYVSLSDQRLFRLRLPRIEAQRAIGCILGSLDDKIELNRRTNETLEAMARTLFRSWFVDFDPVRAKADGQKPQGMDAATAKLFPNGFELSALGPIPKGWRVEPLDGIAEFLNGLALQKYPPEAGKLSLPAIKIAQLNAGNTHNADRAGTNLPTQYVVRDGDLLFSWSGSLEVVIWCGGDGALNQHLFKVTSSNWPKWLIHQWLLEHLPDFRRIAAAKATTMGHIQRHHLHDAKVVLPSPEVLRVASGIVSLLIERVVANNLESRTLAATRDALLPKLLSGEVRVGNVAQIVEKH